MTDAPPASTASPAWQAVLPPDTRWLSGPDAGARRLGRDQGSACPQQPWAARMRPWALPRSGDRGDPAGVRSYIAVPSQQAPILIASRDREVLRYVAGSVLSVPPGTGSAASMVLTAGLRLLRFRLAWNLLAFARLARLVAVGSR
jgi:hypothetical protein